MFWNVLYTFLSRNTQIKIQFLIHWCLCVRFGSIISSCPLNCSAGQIRWCSGTLITGWHCSALYLGGWPHSDVCLWLHPAALAVQAAVSPNSRPVFILVFMLHHSWWEKTEAEAAGIPFNRKMTISLSAFFLARVLEVKFPPKVALLLINITETELHNICNCCYNGLVFRDLDDYVRQR